jgi:hypothetical protein
MLIHLVPFKCAISSNGSNSLDKIDTKIRELLLQSKPSSATFIKIPVGKKRANGQRENSPGVDFLSCPLLLLHLNHLIKDKERKRC